ncbi:MAG: hypothetical protein R3B70_07680 [Polyangiaceae bacterium]
MTQLVGASVLIAGIRAPSGKAPAPCTERLYARRPCAPASPVQISIEPLLSPSMAGGGLSGVF